jgi:mannitol/fructose-specific phosphotransferase system IIA component
MPDILTQQTICLQGQAESKQDAIRKAGELLVQGGCVDPKYIEGMLAREETMSTYVGNGFAIPHGLFDDLSLIFRTGISVLQLPTGVEWEEGEMAYMVVGIAATTDEHVDMLANLAEVIDDPDTAQLLITTTDPKVILQNLNRAPQT